MNISKFNLCDNILKIKNILITSISKFNLCDNILKIKNILITSISLSSLEIILFKIISKVYLFFPMYISPS